MNLRVRLLVGLFLAMLAAASAQAQCLKWEVSGRWQFSQSNNTTTTIDLQRSGNVLTGSAYYTDSSEHFAITWNGSVDGIIEGDRIELTVYWESRSIGIYSGRIAPSGLMQGTAYDKLDPQTRANWSGDHNATCLSDPGGMSNGKPVMALGRVKPATETACAQWVVAGDWNFQQSNDSPSFLKLQQDGTTLSGTGTYLLPYDEDNNTFGRATGAVSGRVVGNAIDFTVRWNTGKVGIYTGTVSPLGRLQGSAYPQDDPADRVDWTSDGRATCAAAVQPKPVGFGRVTPRDPSKPLPSICEASVSARARNSPAAPSLEARCRQIQAAAGPPSPPPPGPLVDRAELDRLAALGHRIASQDYALGSVRRSEADPAYRYGFDVATALFGDPAMGAQGITALGPGQLGIRASLDAVGQAGFDDSKNFHFSRSYGP